MCNAYLIFSIVVKGKEISFVLLLCIYIPSEEFFLLSFRE